MSARRAELRRRIERLSPAQRALLAERAGIAADTSTAQEQLVAWIVPADDATEDGGALAGFLRERLPEHMVPSAFVFTDALPRLPNGKIDNAALPDATPVERSAGGFVAPRNAREEALARTWADVLGIDRIGVHDNFFELGGDSILSIQVVARARRAGLHFTPDLVFRHQTLGALAGAAATAPLAAPSARTLETAPLSPVQSWFFEQPLASPHHWHQAVVLRVPADFDRDRFERAIRAVVARHDALRLTFHREPTGWRQRLAADGAVALHDIAAPPCGEEEMARALAPHVHRICAATDLARGPLLHAGVVRREDGSATAAVIAIHHLVVDAVSWDIVLEDLRVAYDGARAADTPATTPFLSWCDALQLAADSDLLRDDIAFWSAFPGDLPPLPREHDGEFEESTAETVTALWDIETTTRLIRDVHDAYNTNIEDFLLAALARTLTGWTGAARVLVGVERHGREPLVHGADLSRTVGWLTSYFPVVLEAAGDAGETLRATKDMLRAIPHRGAGYGVLRYLRDDVASLPGRHTVPEVIFNHAGRFDVDDGNTGLRPVGPPFASRGDDNRRAHRMEVNTFIAGGALHVHWTGSAAQYEHATLERLTHLFAGELHALVHFVATARTSGFTPADFPDTGLDQASLDRFLEGLSA